MSLDLRWLRSLDFHLIVPIDCLRCAMPCRSTNYKRKCRMTEGNTCLEGSVVSIIHQRFTWEIIRDVQYRGCYYRLSEAKIPSVQGGWSSSIKSGRSELPGVDNVERLAWVSGSNFTWAKVNIAMGGVGSQHLPCGLPWLIPCRVVYQLPLSVTYHVEETASNSSYTANNRGSSDNNYKQRTRSIILMTNTN